MNSQAPIAFRFSGFDALPCFMMAISAAFTFPLIIGFVGLLPSACLVAAGAVLAAGMRVSVIVNNEGVCITKKCFSIPYRIYRAREIHDVWYGGDWGMEEGAECVVLSLGNAEVNVGSSRSMKYLHDNLKPLSTVGKGVAADTSKRAADRASESQS